MWRVFRRGYFKITDAKAQAPPPKHELTEDERFFEENDVDPTVAFIENLERERMVTEERHRLGMATREWQEYDEEVTETMDRLEHEWMVNPQPISKHTVKELHRVLEEAVLHVQAKHATLNDQRIAAYKELRQLQLQKPESAAEEPPKQLPVSDEYAKLLDQFT
jgi:hypothetical protein